MPNWETPKKIPQLSFQFPTLSQQPNKGSDKIQKNKMYYPTHLLLQLEEWLALKTGPWDADDHGFQRPSGR